ncbi:unnamed protein product, partial [Mesorhabditis belari]
MIRVRTRQLWLQLRDLSVHLTSLFAKGLSLEGLFMLTVKPFTSRVSPPVAHVIEMIAVYFLFHIFATFVLILAGIQIFVGNTRLKGRRIIPILPDFVKPKEQFTMWIVTMVAMLPFVSRFAFLWPTLASFTNFFGQWVPTLRPQINIKPQVTVMPPSSASSSAQSLVSMQIKSVKPGLSLGLEATNKKVAQMLRNVQMYADGAIAAQQITNAIAEQPDEIDDFQDAIEEFEGVEEADFETASIVSDRPAMTMGSDTSDTDMESEI